MSAGAMDYTREAPVVEGRPTASAVDAVIAAPLDEFPSRTWWIAFTVTSMMLGTGLFCVVVTVGWGLGVWGINQPVAWGFDIVNFVFWIGIGHAGT
ncbi:MAG: hydrogenase, partial [Bacteroidetes bacterium]|nr:hydrogenase [Bacteroidota bacterium]